MKLPTHMERFDLLYSIVSSDGREEKLFGDSIRYARSAFEKMLIGAEFPGTYLEFPLIGPACFDVLAGYDHMEQGAVFAPGAGYGYQKLMDWFSALPVGSSASCGFSADTSRGETEKAGVYLKYDDTGQIRPFLDAAGEVSRFADVQTWFASLPEGWHNSYIGLFPGREGAPLRLGCLLTSAECKHILEEPSRLERALQKVGFTAYTERMLDQCVQLLRFGRETDIQFDLYPDGTIGDTLGIELAFYDCATDRDVFRESGVGGRLMRTFQEWGIADERWKLIPDSVKAGMVLLEQENNRLIPFAVVVGYSYAKVKFLCGRAALSKFYYRIVAKPIQKKG